MNPSVNPSAEQIQSWLTWCNPDMKPILWVVAFFPYMQATKLNAECNIYKYADILIYFKLIIF